jgi:hypothetical protein
MQSVRGSRVTHVPVALLFALCAASEPMHAGAIALGGFITQSTQDSGVPAAANPGLNNIVDGDAYSVVLNFTGGIASPGTYALTSVLFTDGTASENAFISGSLTITQAAGVERFSVLGCLIDASTCLLGNELDLNFQIPAAQLNQTGVAAQPIPGLLPLDLLEDGGSTDIQGSVTSYSYAAASQVPEPSTMGLIGASILALIAIRNKTTLGGKRC